MSADWFKGAVTYSLDVASFSDSDGDGLGDVQGAITRLDHLEQLGIGCVWVQPIFQSPRRDDGYDVTNHVVIDARLGSLDAVRDFVDSAHARGMHVLFDLVANHTSNEHPWFRAERRNQRAPDDARYVWSDQPRNVGAIPIFPGSSDHVWTWDEKANAHYLARFYPHEPELATGNREVRRRTKDIISFWTDLGVDGFRLDAAPYLVQKAAWTQPRDDGRWILAEIREHLSACNEHAVLVAEADIDPDHYRSYIDAGIHAIFNFSTNNDLFLALARSDAEPLRRAVRALPGGPNVALLNWVRNHDELDLERLTPAERADVYDAFAPQDDMRIYGRGIRRRLAPMLNGDRTQMALAYAITFSLPGCAYLRYGDEIGMGDDLRQQERLAVRTAMQWSAGRNAGFSDAPTNALQRAVIAGGDFGYPNVNVETQQRDSSSFLHTIRKLLQIRQRLPEIGRQPAQCLDAPPSIFALLYDGHDRAVLTTHNLTASTVSWPLPETSPEARTTLPPCGSRWFIGHRRDDAAPTGPTVAWTELT